MRSIAIKNCPTNLSKNSILFCHVCDIHFFFTLDPMLPESEITWSKVELETTWSVVKSKIAWSEQNQK